MRLTSWLSAVRILGFSARTQRSFQKRSVGRNLGLLEQLEERTLLTYTASVVGNAVTFTGDAIGDTLTLDTSGGGFLQHNRFGTDAGFASAIDLVSGDGATVTSILVTSITSLTVNAGAGNDIIQLNGLTLTAATTVSLDGQGNTDTIETITGAVSVGAGSATFVGETININSALSTTATTSLQSTTLNLANNVTAAGGISGTATTINVQNNTAQIQDAVDAAGTAATINIAAGNYIGSIDATAGGKAVTLAPAGSPTTGQVTISGNLSLNANDGLQIQISGTTAGTNYDDFVVGGDVALGGAGLIPTLPSFTPTPGNKFVIIANNGANPVGSTFAGLAEGAVVTVGSTPLRVSYVDGGNDVALTALNPSVVVTYSNGNLTLTGTTLADDIIIDFTGTNSVTLIGSNFTNFSGTGTTGQTAGAYSVTGNISVVLKDGNDTVLLRGRTVGAKLDSGTITLDLGAGNDTVTTTNALTLGLTLTGDLSIIGGTGDDSVSLGSAAAGDIFAANSIAIDTGAGAIQSVTLNAVTASSNLTITNGGTGLQTAQIGNTTASGVGGNLTINQSNAANTGGYAVTVNNTAVTGNLTVINGTSTVGSATTTISASTNKTVAGTTFLQNGNNASNTVNLTGSAANLTLTKNITVINGIATGANAINVNGVTGSAQSAASFTNGNAASNGITFGASRANSFLGMVSAVNGNALTTTNAITVNNTSIGKTTNFTNGSALTTNTVTIGNNSAVSSGGNLVIKNGVGTTSDNILISLLTASADVTLSNGASGATTVTLGGAVTNTVAGNMVITNLATTGARAVTIDRTTVSGRTGLQINNSGAGVSTVNIGVTVGVTIVGKLDVQDGTSDATLRLDTVTVGSITYNDLGGGVDTLNLANAAGSLQVSGVTRLNTGLGSDIINMAATGTTIFNDSVFISLGTGNDSLTIGANGFSPAFSTARRFQFDGDGGTDTITVNPLSVSDYVAGSVPKRLKSKITNFENIL